MSWHCFRLRLRLKTDMHCGSLALGFVSRAFPYVPQHVPLYASVPAAVAALGLPDIRPSYQAVEDLLFPRMRTSPFFVLDESGDGARPLFPWDAHDRAVLEADFMGSRYGVALDAGSRSAEENRLFETEVLLARRRGSGQPVRVEGFVWLCAGTSGDLVLDPAKGIMLTDGSRQLSWPELLGGLMLGGDRTRNLGQIWPDVELEEVSSLWDGMTMHLDREWPCLEIPAGGACPVALEADGQPGSGAPFVVMTGRRIRRGGGYDMDKGVVAHDLGWRPDNVLMVELAGERCARAVNGCRN